MSKLCKIESPISLHLMSLNFVKEKEKKQKKNEEESKTERAEMRERVEEENKSSALFWGKFTQHESGCKCL